MDGTDRADGAFGFRRYLAGLAAGVVAVVALLGAVIGVTAGPGAEAIRVLHVVTIRPTPLSMAALAGGIATALLLVLFGLLRVASRYDDESRG